LNVANAIGCVILAAMHWKFGRSKPVIGIIGGIGCGKSAVAAMFAREGCAVIDSDALAHEVLESEEVKAALRAWLGEAVFADDRRVSRKTLGELVFADAEKLKRLNSLVHPRIGRRRDELMTKYLADPGVKAIVWDTPLLVEVGLDRECDAVVFIKTSREVREARVRQRRGWSAAELEKREKSQIGLDKKAAIADYCIDNSGDEVASVLQVQRVLSHLFSKHHS
jgi:dephospho-CoA kinase